MKRKYFALMIFFILFINTKALIQASNSQIVEVDFTHEDEILFERYKKAMEKEAHLSMGELVLKTALYFREIPYVASTLEKEPERLIINLREMDCTTFVENVVALSQTLKGEEHTFENFCNRLLRLRYRKDTIENYLDRLHYFSDWIYENESKGLVKDITADFGGKPYQFNLHFMSTHPESYQQLKKNTNWVTAVQEKEKEISQRDNYFLIKKESIDQEKKDIQNGDIVCFVTSINGLDITHVGIVYWQSNSLNFIHASSSAKKVVIDSKSLQEYAKGIKKTIGIMLVRPII